MSTVEIGCIWYSISVLYLRVLEMSLVSFQSLHGVENPQWRTKRCIPNSFCDNRVFFSTTTTVYEKLRVQGCKSLEK